MFLRVNYVSHKSGGQKQKASMQTVPTEILNHIIKYSKYRDAIRLYSACKILREKLNDVFWRLQCQRHHITVDKNYQQQFYQHTQVFACAEQAWFKEWRQKASNKDAKQQLQTKVAVFGSCSAVLVKNLQEKTAQQFIPNAVQNFKLVRPKCQSCN